MRNLVKIAKAQTKGKILLKLTKAITKEESETVKDLACLYSLYQEGQEIETAYKAGISIVNSILFQKRVFFCMTRDAVAKLVKSDKNWIGDVGWSDSYYSNTLRYQLSNKYIKPVDYVGYNSRKPAMYEVIDAEILALLSIDAVAQKQECINFVNYLPILSNLPEGFEDLQYLDKKGKWVSLEYCLRMNSKDNFGSQWNEIDKQWKKFLKLSESELPEDEAAYEKAFDKHIKGIMNVLSKEWDRGLKHYSSLETRPFPEQNLTE